MDTSYGEQLLSSFFDIEKKDDVRERSPVKKSIPTPRLSRESPQRTFQESLQRTFQESPRIVQRNALVNDTDPTLLITPNPSTQNTLLTPGVTPSPYAAASNIVSFNREGKILKFSFEDFKETVLQRLFLKFRTDGVDDFFVQLFQDIVETTFQKYGYFTPFDFRQKYRPLEAKINEAVNPILIEYDEKLKENVKKIEDVVQFKEMVFMKTMDGNKFIMKSAEENNNLPKNLYKKADMFIEGVMQLVLREAIQVYGGPYYIIPEVYSFGLNATITVGQEPDKETYQKQTFFEMEHVGRTLHDYLAVRTRMSLDVNNEIPLVFCKVLSQLQDMIAYLSGLHFIHGDLHTLNSPSLRIQKPLL